MNSQYRFPEAIMNTATLTERLADPRLRLFECTTYLDPPTPGVAAPYTVRPGLAEYEAGHIPGAAFLDLQADLSDNSSAAHLRFTMPAPRALGDALVALGVGDDSQVVLYSRGNRQWSTRVWWMLRAIGFDHAAVLDGGWERWLLDERPVSTEPLRYPPSAGLRVAPRPELFVDRAAVLAAIGDPGSCTLNALAADLHRGDNERYGRPGRIPGSVNIPAASLLDERDGTFLPAATVAERLRSVGATPERHNIVYCGGGIAATLDAFLMVQLGYPHVAVYDASMSEWARDPALPIERG